MRVNLLYRLILTDQNGNIVKRTHWKKSRSFVIQFLQHLAAINQYADKNITDVTGTSKVVRGNLYMNTGMYAYHYLSLAAPDNNASFGIVVGTGNTAPTNTDYKLVSQIAHGVGAGQLDYGATSFTDPAVVGANVDYVMSRAFYNGSGANITVNEIGMYAEYYAYYNSAYTYWYFCIVRDVTTITVSNTQTLTVQYTIRTTV
jgi:hypothetical protein